MKRNPWTRSARQWTEIGWTAPWVVAQRMAQIAAAGLSPSAADRRELRLMVDEKVVAAARSQMAYWQHLWLEQQKFAWQWWSGGWLTSAWIPPSRQAKHAFDRFERATARATSASLLPVQRRVRANAKRLRRR